MSPDASTGVDTGCRLLDWDSEFFGHRIANVDASAARTMGMDRVDEWCRQHCIDCAYLLVDAGDQSTIAAAEWHRFRLMDVRVTLAAPTPSATIRDGGVHVRAVAASDVARLKTIARESHRDTRFYVDAHFDRTRCDGLYEVWIEKSCNGWADHVVVADGPGGGQPVGPVGYATCHLRAGEGQIGLVGVDAAHRGRGIGRAMIAGALQWFAARGIPNVSVVTQGRNAGGIRLYQSMGLTVRSLQLWFHRWFTDPV